MSTTPAPRALREPIIVRPEERAGFFGRTGSGKTTIARALLRKAQEKGHRTIVFDAKHTYVDGGIKVRDHVNPKLTHQIVRVSPDGSESERWNEAFYDAWEMGDAILYVDEATLVTPPRTILPGYGRCIRTGREVGLGTWTGSQRPKDIPSVIFTEAEHVFGFRLQWSADVDKVASFTTESYYDLHDQLRGRRRMHDFVYYNVIDDRLVYVHASRAPAGSS